MPTTTNQQSFRAIGRRSRISSKRLARQAAWLVGLGLLLPASGLAQGPGNNYYQPLNQMTPPGTVGAWEGIAGRTQPAFLQPVRVSLPEGGRVVWYQGSPDRGIENTAPAQAGLLVGQLYRLKISHMPDYPGVELYPSVEVLDRLHTPPGKETEFPIPVDFSDSEIDLALEGRLITKVVYLEQPQLAVPRPLDPEIDVATIPGHLNLLQVADQRGRPMAIVRLGSRLPDPHAYEPGFYGSGAPVQPLGPPPAIPVEPAIPAEPAEPAAPAERAKPAEPVEPAAP